MVNEKRLIDANALLQSEIKRCRCIPTIGSGYSNETSFKLILDEAPTVDAVEVVHGRWEKTSETMPICRCSVCKERNLFKNGYNVLSNYCPNCGAKMDGGNEK